MPKFRIHRMKDSPRQSFRWAPHVSGAAQVKPKDYELEVREIEAAHEYAAWTMLRESEQPLGIGDLLERESGELCICKYVGFEQASWLVTEAHVTAAHVSEALTGSATDPAPVHA
jgi:hypothetical protein